MCITFILKQGNEAANVTGPQGVPVKGSKYAADKRFYRARFRGGFGSRGRRPGGPRRNQRRGDQEGFDSAPEGEGGKGKGSRDNRAESDGKDGEEENGENGDGKGHYDGSQGPRGQKRYFRRFFRRRSGRPPRSDTEGSQSGADGEASGNDQNGGTNEKRQGGRGQRGPPRRKWLPRTRGNRAPRRSNGEEPKGDVGKTSAKSESVPAPAEQVPASA